jgi:hypothetical protein
MGPIPELESKLLEEAAIAKVLADLIDPLQ